MSRGAMSRAGRGAGSLVATLWVLCGAAAAHADTFSGDLYYTNRSPSTQTVNQVAYSYNDVTNVFSLGAPVNLVSGGSGDGIIFDVYGNLLVGTGGTATVNMYTPTGTAIDSGTAVTAAFHLALDPTGNYVYTSAFGGQLEVLPLALNSVGNSTQYTVMGDETGLTSVAYAPTTGNWFYIQDPAGGADGNGDVGLINMTNIGTATHTVSTTQLFGAVAPAHSLTYDSYTGLMTMFGDGRVGTFNQSGGGLDVTVSAAHTDAFGRFKDDLDGDVACVFDQGTVDGLGHAMVAGCDAITFLDYRMSGDITNPDHVFVVTGFTNIDDVAPLSGVGSQDFVVPEPGTLLLLGGGLLLVAHRARRKIKA